jgi:hypothetical protein
VNQLLRGDQGILLTKDGALGGEMVQIEAWVPG